MKVRLELAIALLLAAPVPGFAQEPAEPTIGAGSAHVSGSVVDHQTGEALEGARVTLNEADGEGAATRLTTADGRFRFSSVKAQAYQVEILFLGYKTVEVEIRPIEGDEARIEVEMVQTVVALEPMVVTATRRSRLHRVGFHQRQRFGLGRFYDRGDIEELNLTLVTDLFRRVAGFRVAPGGRAGSNVILGRGNCPPTVFLDGVRLVDGGASIDEVLRPESVEGLEIYHASQTPAQFRGGRCGTVVAWSRSPEPGPDGRSFSWRRVLFAVGFLGLAVGATSF